MKKIFTTALAFLLFNFLPVVSFGQTTLTGVITDKTSGEALIGANVFLTGTSLGGVTDLYGKFRIANIPSGSYSVRVSYISYATQVVDVIAKENADLTLAIQLQPEALQGEEVIITAQMRGQVAAINQQVSSSSIMNVVSEEKIKELPDANAAEAIGRLSGVSLIRNGGEASSVVLRGLSPKYTNITIDGVKIPPTSGAQSNGSYGQDRGVDLSIISQGSLSGIELLKALTSDKDADAIAGSINLVTRKAPSEMHVTLDAKGDYNGMDKSADQYNFNGQFGQRFFDDLLGVQAIGNLEQTIRSQESTTKAFVPPSNPTDTSNWQYSTFNIVYQNEIRKRKGGSILLDFNTPDNGSIRFNNVYNQTSRTIYSNERQYPQGGPVDYYYRNQEIELKTFNSSLRGENYLLGFDLDWNIAFSETRVKIPYNYYLYFYETSNLDSLNLSGMGGLPSGLTKTPEAWIPFAYNNFKAATLYRGVDASSETYDKERTGFIDITRKFNLGQEITDVLKFGGKYRTKSRSMGANEFYAEYYLGKVAQNVLLSDGSFGLKDYSGSRFAGLEGSAGVPLSSFLDSPAGERNIFGTSRLYPLINGDALRLWRQLNINGYKNQVLTDANAEYARNDLVRGGNYSLTERVAAGYVMNTINLGTSITFILGVRLEAENNDYASFYTPLSLSGANLAPQGLFTLANKNHKETMVLPNIQAILRPTDFMNIRLAAYQSMARPDFNDRLPLYVAKSSSGNTLTMGNPNLKNALASNYEAQVQIFGDNIGLFSVSGFFKHIKNIQQSLNNFAVSSAQGTKFLDSLQVDWRTFAPATGFTFVGKDFTLTYPYNSPDPTRVWGFEVEHQADLKFLPGMMKYLVLNYNFTLLRSETWILNVKQISVPNPRPGFPPIKQNLNYKKMEKLQDQPEFFANASLGYDYERFSTRVSYFYQGAYNRSFSTDTENDVVQDAYSRWDVTFKQGVTDNISFILNINNLTNSAVGTSWADRLIGVVTPNNSIKYGTTFDLGVRLEF